MRSILEPAAQGNLDDRNSVAATRKQCTRALETMLPDHRRWSGSGRGHHAIQLTQGDVEVRRYTLRREVLFFDMAVDVLRDRLCADGATLQVPYALTAITDAQCSGQPLKRESGQLDAGKTGGMAHPTAQRIRQQAPGATVTVDGLRQGKLSPAEALVDQSHGQVEGVLAEAFLRFEHGRKPR